MEQNSNNNSHQSESILTPPLSEIFPASHPNDIHYIEGIDGWLTFWISTISVASLASLTVFYISVTSGFKTMDNYVATIFSIIMAISFISTIYFIFARKKLAKLAITIALGAAALNSVICLLVSGSSTTAIFVMLGAIFIQLICSGICVLYFYKSKRVRQTLIK